MTVPFKHFRGGAQYVQSSSLLQEFRSFSSLVLCLSLCESMVMFLWHVAISPVLPEPQQKSKKQELVEVLKLSSSQSALGDSLLFPTYFFSFRN